MDGTYAWVLGVGDPVTREVTLTFAAVEAWLTGCRRARSHTGGTGQWAVRARRARRHHIASAWASFLVNFLLLVASHKSIDPRFRGVYRRFQQSESPGLRGDPLCPPRVVTAVEALTRRQGKDCEVFVAPAAEDPVARVVKRADVADNANEGRLALLPNDLAVRLRAKYARAMEILDG